MPERYTIMLPLPPKAVSQNARGHWSKRAKATARYRETCGYLMRLAGIGELQPPVVWNQDYFASREDSRQGLYHAIDEDSAVSAMKAARDALQDAGIVPSDARKNLRLGTCRLFTTARECKGPGRVVVTLEVGGGDA
jgi:crossover junction endodeoxyribonuclease RusA